MHKPVYILTLALLLVSLLLAGCNGSKEIDDVAWVISVGIDKAGDELEITYRLAVPKAIVGEAGGSSKKQPTTLVTVKAATLGEGRNLLSTAVSRSVSLSQVRVIVISEELARTGVEDLIGPLVRFREFRGSIFLMVCRGSTKEIFEKNDPAIETLTSRWVENFIQSASEDAYYPHVNLHEFYLRLKSMSGAPFALYYALNPLNGRGRPAGPQKDGEATQQYLPGDVPRASGDPAEVLGTAVFKGAKMIGALDTEETRAFMILQNRLRRNFLVVKDPLEPKRTVNIAIRNGSKPKITVDTAGSRPGIRIAVFIEGEITAIPTGIAYEQDEYRTLLEAQVSNVIRQHIVDMLAKTQAWGADVVDFGYYARGNFATQPQMKEYQWGQLYPAATFDVTVKTELRRSGLMQKSMPIRRE